MPFPRSHGRPYAQPDDPHELTDGVPVPVNEQAEASQERKAGGNGIAPGATIVPAMGGRARKGRTKLTHEITTLPVSDALKRRARYARKKICSEWAATVGGGTCGVVASLMAKLGIEDATMREAALAEGKIDLARKLGESARMHLVYGREIAAKDAAARPKHGNELAPWFVREEGGKP